MHESEVYYSYRIVAVVFTYLSVCHNILLSSFSAASARVYENDKSALQKHVFSDNYQNYFNTS